MTNNDDSELRDILSETVHTAFRKGCEEGFHVWAAISAMNNKEYGNAIAWVIWALGEMGYEIRKKEANDKQTTT